MMESLSMPADQRRYRHLFWLLLGAVTVFRLIVAGCVGLSADESHYALYARHVAWGYFDHPPMVGILGALTTISSDHVFFLRLGPIVCSFLSVVALRSLALQLFGDERIAFWGIVLLLAMPVHHLLGMALLPDATLNVFWCGCLLAAWRAMKEDRWTLWLAAGFLFGGALLSKYHGVLLPACLLGYMATSRETRRWLWNPKPYVAALAGLMVFLPNILWNYRHDWISYAYQLGHGGGSGQFGMGKLCEMLGGQLAAASPVVLGLFLAACVDLLRSRQPMPEAQRFAMWASVPVFLFFCGIGLWGKILPHWPVVGWWGGVLLLSSVIVRKGGEEGTAGVRWRRWAVAGVGVGIVMIMIMHAAMAYPIVEPVYEWARGMSCRLSERCTIVKPMPPFDSKHDITNDMYGWDQAARRVERIRSSMPDPSRTFVFSHRFFTISQLGVHLKKDTVATSLGRRPDQYRLWFKPEPYVGWDALFVDDKRWRHGREEYEALFMAVDGSPIRLDVRRMGRVAHVLEVYRCFGFKGKYED